jgi:hypothetical protein
MKATQLEAHVGSSPLSTNQLTEAVPADDDVACCRQCWQQWLLLRCRGPMKLRVRQGKVRLGEARV